MIEKLLGFFTKSVKSMEFSIPELNKSSLSIDDLFTGMNPQSSLKLTFPVKLDKDVTTRFGYYDEEIKIEDIISRLKKYMQFLKEQYGLYAEETSFRRVTKDHKDLKKHMIKIETKYANQFKHFNPTHVIPGEIRQASLSYIGTEAN